MAAMAAANDAGHRISYGDDDFTDSASALFREIFGEDSALWFVYNGTAANVVAIRSLIKGYQAVLAPRTAHIEEDECGSLEAISGSKIEFLPQIGGKINADDIPGALGRLGFVHSVQPALVSITQSTELGQRYSLAELKAIGKVCAEHGLLLHMDGARIANAVAGELADTEPGWRDLSGDALVRRGREILAAMTADAGVHALSLGGTKNGLMFGEGIVLMNGAQANGDLPFYRKQTAQLASKMRYISAQFEAMYREDIWLRNALHANDLARRLEEGISDLAGRAPGAGLRVKHPVAANALFVVMPHAAAKKLQETYHFYAWDKDSYRLMTSWDSREEDVDRFLGELEAELSASLDGR
jgi:threonine aldolase